MQGHHPIHLGIEAGSTSDETGDDEGKDNEGAHEELSGVGEQEDGVLLQFQGEEAKAEDETADDTGECDQEEVFPEPGFDTFNGDLGYALLHSVLVCA